MNKTKLIFIIFLAFSVLHAQTKKDYESSTISQINQLSDYNKNNLSQSFVIIKGDIIFVETEEINGINLSKVIIDSKLIKDPQERFLFPI